MRPSAPPKPWERAGVALPSGTSMGTSAMPNGNNGAASTSGSAGSQSHDVAQSQPTTNANANRSTHMPPNSYSGYSYGGYGAHNNGHGGAAYGTGLGYGGYNSRYGTGVYGGGNYGAGAYGGSAFGGGFYGTGPFGAFGRGVDPDKDPMPPGLRHLEDFLVSIGRITQVLEMNFEVLQHFLGSAAALFERLSQMYHNAQRATSVIHRQSLEFGESSYSVVRRFKLHAREHPLKFISLIAFCFGLLARYKHPRLRRSSGSHQTALLNAFAAAAAAPSQQRP